MQTTHVCYLCAQFLKVLQPLYGLVSTKGLVRNKNQTKKKKTYFDPVILLLEIYPMNILIDLQKGTCRRDFLCDIINFGRVVFIGSIICIQ